MKKNYRKFFSVLMVLCMMVSFFAPNPLTVGAAVNDDTVTNGEYDENGIWSATGDEKENESKLHPIDGTEVTLSKTAKALGNDTFEITLQVQTSTNTVEITNSAAVVLVIDTSSSMTYYINGEQRIVSAKNAALEFLKTYAGTDDKATRMLSIVTFNSSGEVQQDWINVAGGKDKNAYNTAVDMIKGLSTSRGTHMEDGLFDAKDQLGSSKINGITNKSVVLLSDGAPSMSGDATQPGVDTAVHCAAAETQATAIKVTGAELYTVCFGAAGDTAYSVDYEKVTVSAFLKDEIASTATSEKTYAYDADDSAQLLAAFKAISETIVSGLKGEGWTAIDPMNQAVYIEESTGVFSDTSDTINWELSDPVITTATEGGATVTTYTYTYTYTVAVNFGEIEGYEEGTFYPTNGPTYLMVNGTKYDFPVPGVKGTLFDVSGTKIWVDADDQDGKRPESITINLLANDEKIKTITVDEKGEWKWIFTDLAKYEDGKEIKYTLTEDPVTSYKAPVYSGDAQNGFVVTNTHEIEKVNVSVEKKWNDANDQDGLQPDSVTITLLAAGEDTGKNLTLSADNGWKGTFENLDKYKNGTEIKYTVTEKQVTGYEQPNITGSAADGYVVTNTHTPSKISIPVEKVWDDADDQDGLQPDSVTITLLADEADTGKTLSLSADNGWKGTFENLDEFKTGKKINYTVSEAQAEGYEKPVITGTMETGFVVTNTHKPSEISIPVEKVWDDADDQDGLRPNDIIINLFGDGEYVESAVLNQGNNWQHTFIGLPVNKAGEPIEYTVREAAALEGDIAPAAADVDSEVIPGYTTTYSGNAKDGFTVTNTHNPEVITLNGTKKWEDADDANGMRPESVTIRLRADGEVVDSVTVTKETQWTYQFKDLPVYKEGTLIKYTITEDAVDDYTPEIVGMDVTNHYTPNVTSVSVTKVWNDADNQDGVRLNEVKIQLLANGKDVEGKTLILSEGNKWIDTFTNLPVKIDKEDVTYSVREVTESEYYTPEITGNAAEGYIVTNTHEPAVTEVAGTKTWDDNNNQDGKRPESITVNLIANGEKIDSVEVTEADGWAYKFENLPKYEAGEEIEYAVTEDVVEGYTVAIDGYDLTNSYTPELTSVTVTKNWQDTNDKDGIRPDSVTVRLLANGKDTGLALKLSAEYKWVGMFAELPAYENGEKIEYTVAEDAVKEYNTVITGSAEKGFEITNSHTSVPKTGDDSNITLYASIGGVSLVALLAMVVIMKKKKAEEN